MEWMLLPLKRYVQFTGRSQRKEFWMYVLLLVILGIVASILDYVLGFGRLTTVSGPGVAAANFQSRGPIGIILNIATLLPTIAVSVRRLHDTNRTGWWILLPLVPVFLALVGIGAGVATQNMVIAGLSSLFMLLAVVAGIVLVVFYCLDGTQGPNRFGEDPKHPTTEQYSDIFR